MRDVRTYFSRLFVRSNHLVNDNIHFRVSSSVNMTTKTIIFDAFEISFLKFLESYRPNRKEMSSGLKLATASRFPNRIVKSSASKSLRLLCLPKVEIFLENQKNVFMVFLDRLLFLLYLYFYPFYPFYVNFRYICIFSISSYSNCSFNCTCANL